MSLISNYEGNKLTVKSENGEELLTVTNIVSENKIQLTVSGAIKTLVAPAFSERLIGAVNDYDIIVLDFADVSYIASAGLRALLSAQQIIDSGDKQMKIINACTEVRNVFETTGFINIINIEI